MKYTILTKICVLALTGFHKRITRSRKDNNHCRSGLFLKRCVQFKIREDLSIFISLNRFYVEVLLNTNKKHHCWGHP